MNQSSPPSKNIFALLKGYRWLVVLLIALTVLSNALNLFVPKIIANAIDTYTLGTFMLQGIVIEFSIVAILIFSFTYLQSIVQTYVSEKVARDLRLELATKISLQDYAYIDRVTPSKLLTNLTSDIDAVKTFVSQAIASIISSIFLIIGSSVLLLLINWKLALVVISIIPIIGVAFAFVLTKVRKFFKKAQEAIDWLNKIISESILGSALIRLLNSQAFEYDKFMAANTEAKNIGLSIVRMFASLIPVITFSTNAAMLAILLLGGHFVMTGSMTLGDFSAFNNYLIILVFPILIIGFMSGVIAQASASYQRIFEVLIAPERPKNGSLIVELRGDIEVKNISVSYGEKTVLRDVSFVARAGTMTAIIGPTAAGKTQLLFVLTGLLDPSSGSVEYDGQNIASYDKKPFHEQIGLVFQDSNIFNLTVRENIAFSKTVQDADIEKAIATAELRELIDSLPDGLDTVVSERGTSLSGGQKQRIMLARALALDPKILFLDDFTARLDANTEQKILGNIRRNYPDITLVSVTQKIDSVADYDQIILLMEGEILAVGTHAHLLESSPEYIQIYNSQRSTTTYELPA